MSQANRKPRSDSVAAIVEGLYERALGPLPVPKHINLRPADLPNWRAILASRPRHAWRSVELPLVAECARLTTDLASPPKRGGGLAETKLRAAKQKDQLRILRALGIFGHRVGKRPMLPAQDDSTGLIAW